MASKGFQETGMGDEASLLQIFLSRTYWKLEQLRRKGFGCICLGESFVGFFSQQLQFALRASGKFRVRAVAGAPAAINVGIPHTHIEGVVTHLELGSFNARITHGLAPVVQGVHPHSHSWFHLCCPLPRGGKRCFEKGVVILKRLVRPLAIAFHTEFIGFAWGHAKRWMYNGLIFLIGPLPDALCKLRQRPDGLAFGICRAGSGAWLPRGLCVAQQMVEKFCFHRAKQTFLGRSESWLGGWSLRFANPIQRV